MAAAAPQPDGEAGVEHELRHLRGDERVLLGRHHLDGIDARRVVPGKMQMGVAEAGHQRRAHAVDHGLSADAAAAVHAATSPWSPA